MKAGAGVWLLIILLPVGADAFFPTSEKGTPGEVLKYRMRKKEEYRQAQQDYEHELSVSKVRVQGAMAEVPWPALSSRSARLTVSEETFSALHRQKSGQKKILLLTGFAAVALFAVVMQKVITRMSDS